MTSSVKNWESRLRLGRLLASRCQACERVDFPPRNVCFACGNREHVLVRLSSAGKLLAFTASTSAGATSRYVGIVELADGVRLTCQLADCQWEDLRVGMPVKLVFRRIFRDWATGAVRYGHKAIPECDGDLGNIQTADSPKEDN